MDLYKLHTAHIPLDKDTYDGKESKYARLDLKQNHYWMRDWPVIRQESSKCKER